jgi:hypothetical protein
MQIQELMKAAFMQATANPYPPRRTALIIFNAEQLISYTEIIIKAAVEETVKSEGKLLDD